jgi:hypothetical protein
MFEQRLLPSVPAAVKTKVLLIKSVTRCHADHGAKQIKGVQGTKKNSGRDRVNRIEHNKTDLFRYEANTAEYATGCGAQQIQ